PMHDALPFRRTGGRDPVPGPGEGAEHGRAVPSRRRMGRHSDRLVDHDDVVVIVHDVEARNELRNDRRLELGGPLDLEPPRPRPIRLAQHDPVEAHAAGFEHLLREGAREPEQTRDRRIRPISDETVGDRHAAPLHHSPADGADGGVMRSMVSDALVPSRCTPRSVRSRKRPIAVQIATSAMLKIAGKPQICRKSMTCPMPKLGSRKSRSVTLPSAPPSSSPSIQAHAVDLIRLAKTMIATITPTATIERIQVKPLASENAAPEFFTKWNCSTSPSTGTTSPTSRFATMRYLASWSRARIPAATTPSSTRARTLTRARPLLPGA